MRGSVLHSQLGMLGEMHVNKEMLHVNVVWGICQWHKAWLYMMPMTKGCIVKEKEIKRMTKAFSFVMLVTRSSVSSF